MTEITEEMLISIEEHASLFLTIEEIALLIDVDFVEFKERILTPNDPVGNAYQRGKLKTKVELRKSVIKMALKGSPQGEMLTEEYIKKQALNEI